MNVRMMQPQGPMGQSMPQGGALAPMGQMGMGPPPLMPQQPSNQDKGLGSSFGGNATGRGQFRQFMSSKRQMAPQMPIAPSMEQSPMLPPPMPTNMAAIRPMRAPNMGSAPQLGRSVRGTEGGIGSAPVQMNMGGGVPRQTMIANQPHMLAYINPEEEEMLYAAGGSGDPGPGGIPAFNPNDQGQTGVRQTQDFDFSSDDNENDGQVYVAPTYDFGDDDDDDYTSADLAADLAEQGLTNIIPDSLSVAEQINLYDDNDYQNMADDTAVSGAEYVANADPNTGINTIDTLFSDSDIAQPFQAFNNPSVGGFGPSSNFDLDTGVIEQGNTYGAMADGSNLIKSLLPGGGMEYRIIDPSGSSITNRFDNFQDAIGFATGTSTFDGIGDTDTSVGYSVGYGDGQVDPGLAAAIPGDSDYVYDGEGTITLDPIVSEGTGTFTGGESMMDDAAEEFYNQDTTGQGGTDPYAGDIVENDASTTYDENPNFTVGGIESQSLINEEIAALSGSSEGVSIGDEYDIDTTDVDTTGVDTTGVDSYDPFAVGEPANSLSNVDTTVTSDGSAVTPAGAGSGAGSGTTGTQAYLNAITKISAEGYDPNAKGNLTEPEQRALYGARGQTPNAAETAYLEFLLSDAKHKEDSTIKGDDGKPIYKAGEYVTKQSFGEKVEDGFVSFIDTFLNPLSFLGDNFTLGGINASYVEEQLNAYKNGGTFVYGDDGKTVVGVAEPNFDASGDGNNDTVVLFDGDGNKTVTGDGIGISDITTSNSNTDGEDFDIDIVNSNKTYTNTEDGVVVGTRGVEEEKTGDDNNFIICEEGFEFDPVEGICMPIVGVGDGDGTGGSNNSNISIGDVNRNVSSGSYTSVPSNVTGLKINTPKQFNRGGMVTPNISRFVQSLGM